MLDVVGAGYTFTGSMNVRKQASMFEEINSYVRTQMRGTNESEKLPYFDAAEVLRSPSRCHVTADGLHVKMYVDLVRANILFNHLCDEDNNWRENPEQQFFY